MKIGLRGLDFAKSSGKNKKCTHFSSFDRSFPSFCSLVNSTEFHKGASIWKFNNSVIYDCNFIKEMKCFILVTDDVFDEQSQGEILKYEIQKFSICYSKVIAEEKRKKQHELENKQGLF